MIQVSVLCARSRWQLDWRIWLADGAWYTGRGIYDLVNERWLWAALELAAAVFYLAMFWRNRPRGKGKRVAKLIGAKARAVRDRLVAAMPGGSAVPVPA